MDINSFVIGYKKGKASGGGGGGGSLEGFHMVRFFNDDQTTLLYTVFVPTGADVIYAGETPVSTEDASAVFYGFEPATVNVTKDMDCYAMYETHVGTLAETSWERISELSAKGVADNFFAVGDTKPIKIAGTVGTLAVNTTLNVYILGFDHYAELTGDKGITFGTFKTSSGVDVTLCDGYYSKSADNGAKQFNMNHWGNYNYGGWAKCDLRYDVLGSTDVAPTGYGTKPVAGQVGFDATETCATTPVADTLMAALPSELRAVMKPMTIYTDNVGGGADSVENVTASIDYLPLLSDVEVSGGLVKNCNSYEKNKTAQFAYYAAGNARKKYDHSATSTAVAWWSRSVHKNNNMNTIAYSQYATITGYGGGENSHLSKGIAPIFLV